MLVGYARVSTNEPDSAAQVAALKVAGCERIYRENASGGRWDRPELQRLLDQVRKGDVLVVWKLDRLSRSLRDVLMLMERLAEAKAGFRSLTEAIDTTSPAGRMMMQICFCVLHDGLCLTVDGQDRGTCSSSAALRTPRNCAGSSSAIGCLS
jgi:DNA invertase Pin-like site-specific DNA recombinase